MSSLIFLQLLLPSSRRNMTITLPLKKRRLILIDTTIETKSASVLARNVPKTKNVSALDLARTRKWLMHFLLLPLLLALMLPQLEILAPVPKKKMAVSKLSCTPILLPSIRMALMPN
jgi:hypothetical protein